MRCYKCGCDLSEKDFCTSCGADVGTYKQIIFLSNQYYNEGLERAQVRDLTGAKEKLCAKYPGLNIAGGYAPPMGFGKKQGLVWLVFFIRNQMFFGCKSITYLPEISLIS